MATEIYFVLGATTFVLSFALCLLLLWRTASRPVLTSAFLSYLFVTGLAFPIAYRIFPDSLLRQVHIQYSHFDASIRDATGLLWYSAAMLLIAVAAAIVLNRDRQPLSVHGWPVRHDCATYLRLAMITVALGGSLSLGYFLIESGIAYERFLIAQYRTGKFGGSGIYTYPLLHVFPVAACLWIISQGALKQSPSKLLMAAAVILCILPSLLLGFRGYAAYSVVSLMVAHHFYLRPIRLGALMAVGVVFLVMASAYAVVRSSVEMAGAQEVTPDEIVMATVARTQSTQRFAMVLEKEPEYSFFGRQVLEAAAGLLPPGIRPEFQDSATRFGEQVMSEYLIWLRGFGDYLPGGHAPGFVGYGYWQGGALGVVLLSILAGVAAAKTDSVAGRLDTTLLKRGVVCVCFPAILLSVDSPGDMFALAVLRSAILVLLLAVANLLSAIVPIRAHQRGQKTT